MMAEHSTTISWTHRPGTRGETWNPIRARDYTTGAPGWFCVHVSPGCENCYAESMNKWRGNGVAYRAQDRGRVEVYLDEKTLIQPLHWKKPRTIFVCSMTDLFGDWVSDESLDRIYAVMALCPQHTFQVLTKRAERQWGYLDGCERRVAEFVTTSDKKYGWQTKHDAAGKTIGFDSPCWPLPNVWAGVSVEDQKNADLRVPILLETLAAIRFVSYEPALEAVDFTSLPFADGDRRHRRNALTGDAYLYGEGVNGHPDVTVKMDDKIARLDQIIIGGESGPGARPFDLGWARKTIADCKASDTKAFFKQAGSHPILDGVRLRLRDSKGTDLSELPPEFNVQEFPDAL